MKILIVGAKGMLGSILAEVMFEATAWDKEDVDIVNSDDVVKKISDLEPEVIMNAAAYTDVDGAEENRDQAFLINETGVDNLVKAAKKVGAKLVHYSTDYVFSGEQEEGYLEGDEPGRPVNVYGESKLAGEKVLREGGVEYYLIRTAWLYGNNGSNFVNTMLKLGEEKDGLKVVDDQKGSPTFTKDVAEFTKKLLDENYESGFYHAVNSGVVSWYEFSQEIFKIAGMEVRVEPVSSDEFPKLAKRPKFSVLRNTKGPKMSGWREALREYIDVYYKKGA